MEIVDAVRSQLREESIMCSADSVSVPLNNFAVKNPSQNFCYEVRVHSVVVVEVWFHRQGSPLWVNTWVTTVLECFLFFFFLGCS